MDLKFFYYEGRQVKYFITGILLIIVSKAWSEARAVKAAESRALKDCKIMTT